MDINLPRVPALSTYLSGRAVYEALQQEINKCRVLAPEDHDVWVYAFGIVCEEVVFIHPHTLLFRGFNEHGDDTRVVAHFTQVVARISYEPKRKAVGVVTGFAEIGP